MLLISLPDFSPNTEGKAAYERLFVDLEKSGGRLKSAQAIIIDLRRNRGGSSSWSRQVAERLWGTEAVKTALASYFRNSEIWWLAHPDNIRLAGGELAAKLTQATGRREHFYIERSQAPIADGPKPSPIRSLPRVYVITHGSCASACLDAVDLFTLSPRVKLLGAPTSGDSPYMEVAVADLPSKRAQVVIPRKIWMGRPRGSGEIYYPDIMVRDLDWNTEIFLDHVEKDLRPSE